MKKTDVKNIKEKLKTVKIGYVLAVLFNAIILLIAVLFAIFMKNFVSEWEIKSSNLITNFSFMLPQTIVTTMEAEIEENKKQNITPSFNISKRVFDFVRSKSQDEKIKEYIKYLAIEKDENGKKEIIMGDVPSNAEMESFKKNSKRIRQVNRTIDQHYLLKVGLVSDLSATKNSIKKSKIIQDIINMTFGIVILCIIIGIIASILISKVISNPLEKLSKAAKEIADGNFDVKLEKSNFEEINELVDAYNEMGFQLNELYNSLELKVQERTIALEEANNKLKETQAMMVHSEKMRSLGELVAGIAHEINNPVNFIHGNIMILQNYADDLIKLIDAYDENEAKLPDSDKAKIEAIKKDIDLDFLRDDIKELIKSCIEGTQRTKNIVLDLKNFSRMEEMVLTQFDIPKEIDTTLNILNNKYKNRIEVIKNYAPDLPKIEAYGGQLNQVFMNILDNAQDAMAETGTLTINVTKEYPNVRIEFIDTGKGIPEENLKKVFDPFFTTKAVGKGTGLGMSISYRVIKDHNGTIDVESKVGVGTKFTIVLPINHAEQSLTTNTPENTEQING